MPVTQLVLLGVPAFVGVVTGPTTVRFFIDENDFDPNRLIDVDLAKNPQTVPPSAWAQNVDCDYQTTGGLTTIGPTFHAGAHVGGVYISERLKTRYAQVLANWPPAPDEAYQHQAVLRSDNGTVTRYHGFKVRVLSPSVGSLVHVAFIRAGSPATAAGRPQWIDLADPAVADSATNGLTTILPSSAVGTVGALFLTSVTIQEGGGTDVPKYPRSLGW